LLQKHTLDWISAAPLIVTQNRNRRKSVDLEIPPAMDKVNEIHHWQRCLPIEVARDCTSLNSSKLSIFSPGIPCSSAVLHMILDDIMNVAKDEAILAAILSSTLLGAWVNQTIFASASSVDVAFENGFNIIKVRKKMWHCGYYMFERSGFLTGCVASHHPLARLLYSKTSPRVHSCAQGTPYLNLLEWNRGISSYVNTIDKANISLKREDIFPLQCVKIFNSYLPTINNPNIHLQSLYGLEYRMQGARLYNNSLLCKPKPADHM